MREPSIDNYHCKSLKIISHVNDYDHVNYIMEIILSNNKSITTSKRYSECLNLHKSMGKEIIDLKLPKFPPKKFLFNRDEGFLAERQNQLNVYFNKIISERAFYNLPSFIKWIQDIIKEVKDNKENKGQNLENDTEQITKGAIDLFNEGLYDMVDEEVEVDDDVKIERNKKYLEIINENNLFKNKRNKKRIPEGNDNNFRFIARDNNFIRKTENDLCRKLNEISQKIQNNLDNIYHNQDMILKFQI